MIFRNQETLGSSGELNWAKDGFLFKSMFINNLYIDDQIMKINKIGLYQPLQVDHILTEPYSKMNLIFVWQVKHSLKNMELN